MNSLPIISATNFTAISLLLLTLMMSHFFSTALSVIADVVRNSYYLGVWGFSKCSPPTEAYLQQVLFQMMRSLEICLKPAARRWNFGTSCTYI